MPSRPFNVSLTCINQLNKSVFTSGAFRLQLAPCALAFFGGHDDGSLDESISL